MLAAFKIFFPDLASKGFKSLVFESESPTLIAWMWLQGFQRIGQTKDYKLDFQAAKPQAVVVGE
jgi:hypothetical protein